MKDLDQGRQILGLSEQIEAWNRKGCSERARKLVVFGFSSYLFHQPPTFSLFHHQANSATHPMDTLPGPMAMSCYALLPLVLHSSICMAQATSSAESSGSDLRVGSGFRNGTGRFSTVVGVVEKGIDDVRCREL